jgi:hypothetical protein
MHLDDQLDMITPHLESGFTAAMEYISDHATAVIFQAGNRFTIGADEHGATLFTMTRHQLAQAALEEAADLVVYLSELARRDNEPELAKLATSLMERGQCDHHWHTCGQVDTTHTNGHLERCTTCGMFRWAASEGI